MMMSNEKIYAKQRLLRLMKSFSEQNKEIILVSLCTTDGFPIEHISIDKLSTEIDKLAAISSTFSALSVLSASLIISTASLNHSAILVR